MITFKLAGVSALTSALLPGVFLAGAPLFSGESWFDIVFVGAPMLLIPGIFLQRHLHATRALQGAIVAALFGLAGFMSLIVLLPFYMMSSPGSIPDNVFVGLLGVAMLTGLGVMLSCFFARTLPRFLGLLGIVAMSVWMIVLGAALFDLPSANWLGATWLFGHAAFGLGLGFHLLSRGIVWRKPA